MSAWASDFNARSGEDLSSPPEALRPEGEKEKEGEIERAIGKVAPSPLVLLLNMLIFHSVSTVYTLSRTSQK